MKKIVVYDCDGVLFDSAEAVRAYYDFVFDKFDLNLLNWSDKEVHSLAMAKTNKEILEHFVKDEDKRRSMLEFANNLNFKDFTPKMIPSDGIFDSLETLRDCGHDLAVFTNRGISLNYLLEYFEMHTFFSKTVTCFDVKEPKPSPEGLYMIMEHYGADKEELIFIGDSIGDKLAADAAGVDFLAYGNMMDGAKFLSHHLDIVKYI